MTHPAAAPTLPFPSEQYAYRPGRNAQQAVAEVDRQLFHGHPEVIDADPADYFGSIPATEPATPPAMAPLMHPLGLGRRRERESENGSADEKPSHE